MDAETATVLRGRAKAALTRTINFIDKNDQTFDKNDIRNKLEKLELTYTKFDKADAALPIESSEMEEFETKYYETKAKLQNILENLSLRTYVYNENVTYENQPYINKSKFNNSLKCSCCKMNHLVFKCSKFKEMSVKERIQLVNKQKLCMNCLSDRHTESHCNSTFTCHYCKLTESLNSNSMLNLHNNGTNIDNQLKQFWELEEIPNVKDKLLTSEEQFVETHFQNTYACNSDGRFVVKLPFFKSNSELGDSKPAAISRLLAMERKFKNNPDFEKQYKEFMNEYESLGHMSLVNSRSHTSKDQNFLPHHAVIKPSSLTTKLRVVFDASCKTTNGTSLNSLLGVGPKLQRDIFEILLNFRIPRIVFTADIEKMYRQILVADEDQKYQQILWRNNSSENIRTYKLKTVTYGLASASFLATRCIKQIALDDKDNPNLSRVLQEDIYMDDLLSGADTPNNAISICKDIAHVLSTRGFHLRKWNSNSTEFLAQFSEHSSHDARVEFSKDSNESSKVLGLFWNSSNDTFGFQPSLELTPPLTKRRILSESSKIFDPLGLLSPCTVFMKIFYQKLWLTKTDWDSPIPQQLTEDWLRFQKAFNAINYLTVLRWVILTADNIVELHGFADASSLAYAAAIYCRQKHNGKIKVQLLVSKTKVAPVKQVSIPRLELCVLSWLSGHPRQWKTFVANRTSEIIEVLPTKHWRHVPSKENPADIASRGIDPKCLPDCKLWWQGPPWLRLETSSWPKAESSCDEASDEIASQGSSISSSHINTTSLTFSETKTAEETIILWVQDEHGLVRVGGRLQNSQLPFNSKHPIILPSQHSISELLIKEQHIAHLHAGPTLLAHVLRQSHWIVGSRKLINKCIRKCLKCNKFKTSTTTPQLMGNLPKHRATLERPFFSCGIDYAGPVLIKCNKGRGTKSTKGYIALFVCLATKAVHIEAVGDLTTDSFIAALRRFSARRGAPRHIYSRGASFNLQPQRSLGVATENQTGFWKKWSSEFISSLQPRKKWQDAQPNLKEDDIVLIKEEGPPGTWPMARVLQVHPGNDGLVRVATVKTQDSVFKRPVHKLPIYPN
ncbi:integrase catalytic domain-containing protein [Trichonephila clavipes]|nr:integrase catalytic domain-containing protein [Trichonephila clavipes]